VATTNFPKYEQYALTDQVRRSSRATKALIAEAWGRRRYRPVFVNKLDEALGESRNPNHGSMIRLIANTSPASSTAKWSRIGVQLAR
jgi:four helix bundle protein